MNTKPFDIPALNPNPFNIVNMDRLLGAEDMLTALLKFLHEETQYKPENRYIDSVKLLDKITATTSAIEPVLERERNDLEGLFTKY